MNNNDINSKFKELAELKNMAAELKAATEALEAEIKTYMTAAEIVNLIGDEHKASYKEVTSSRFDSTAFRRDFPDIYDEYTKKSSTMRFTFA